MLHNTHRAATYRVPARHGHDVDAELVDKARVQEPADPTRRAIVARLTRGDATVNELAGPFDMTLPGISKHLKVLEHAGLISRTRRAQFRPCHLEREALDAAAGWIEEHRRIWTERFDKLDEHLRDLQGPPVTGKNTRGGVVDD